MRFGQSASQADKLESVLTQVESAVQEHHAGNTTHSDCSTWTRSFLRDLLPRLLSSVASSLLEHDVPILPGRKEAFDAQLEADFLRLCTCAGMLFDNKTCPSLLQAAGDPHTVSPSRRSCCHQRPPHKHTCFNTSFQQEWC